MAAVFLEVKVIKVFFFSKLENEFLLLTGDSKHIESVKKERLALLFKISVGKSPDLGLYCSTCIFVCVFLFQSFV